MAIDFSKKFGSTSTTATTNSNTTNADKPKAQFWLNIGYLTDVKDENTGEMKFVSLASGIALDTMETLAVNSKNVGFANFQAARNDLRDQLIEAAKNLKPGEAAYIGDTTQPVQMQIRRVSEETAAVAGDSNPFSRKLGFTNVEEKVA